MEVSHQISLPETTYRYLLPYTEEMTDLFLRKFHCQLEIRGPKLSAYHASSVKAEIVYKKVLQWGPVVSVWQGDLTTQDADVVVNAANEFLDHAGGLAFALAEAGGPDIVKESKEYIKKHGQIKTGEYALTGPGRLPCKRLLHAVGPIWFSDCAAKCESELAECIRNILKYVDQTPSVQSVAIPAVSSGIFRFPLQICAEIIVETIHSFRYRMTGKKRIRLVNNTDQAVQAMKSACEKYFGKSDDLSGVQASFTNQTGPVTRSKSATPKPAATASSGNTSHGHSSSPKPSAETSITINGLTLHLIRGKIEEQKTKIIVNSVAKDLSLNVGEISKAILFKAGWDLQQEINKQSSAGRTMIPTRGCKLPCDHVYHVILPTGYSTDKQYVLRTLFDAISECLQTAHTHGSHSISFPALGTGNLGLPKQDVAAFMTDAVIEFARRRQCSLDVYFVIYPKDSYTYQAFQSQFNQHRAAMNTEGPSMESRAHPRSDIHDTSFESRDSETPHLIVSAMSQEDIEGAKAWLDYLLLPRPFSIRNNFILLLGKHEHQILSSPEFRDVIMEEKLSGLTSELEIDGAPQNKIRAAIRVERLLLDAQETHAARLKEELLEGAVVWFYKSKNKNGRYPAKANRQLEDAFVAQSDITLNSEPHHDIIIKTLRAKGKDETFELERKVLCSSQDGQKKQKPEDWLPGVNFVNPQSQEFQEKSSEFKKDRLTLVKMEKIQNTYLRHIFQYKKDAKVAGRKTCRAFQLVPAQFTRLVCEVGFQRIFVNPKDTKYGEGIYFTDRPRRAIDLFIKPEAEGNLVYIFEAEILIDSSTWASRDGPILVPKTPHDPKVPDLLDFCDSFTNGKKPSVYVVPNSFQANPLYLYTCKSEKGY